MDRKQFEARIVAKAWKDARYLEALKADPRGTLSAELEAVHGAAKLPAHVKVTVLEETPDQVYLVIPNRPKTLETALDDASLEAVAAGASVDPGVSTEVEVHLACYITAEVNGVVQVVASP